MNISKLTSVKLGFNGNVTAFGVDFKTVQNFIIDFPHKSVRFVLDKITLLSKAVDTLTNGATVIVKEISRATFTAASLTTSLTGANNDVVLTAVVPGAVGNGITLTLVDPGTTHTLSVAVVDQAITATLGYATGAITTTATQLLAALAALPAAAALVSGALAGGNSGAGIVTALAATNLAGGLDYTVLNTVVNSADLADTDSTGTAQELSILAAKEVIEGGNSLLGSITGGASATTDTKDVSVAYRVS